MDVLNKEQRRRNMKAIKSRGTKAEDTLAKALWRKGHRYHRNSKAIIGRPDIVFLKIKLAVFCDGDFWHGKDWEQKRERLSTNRDYWVKKIERNIERDRQVNEALEKMGWKVIRFWDKEIHKSLGRCLEIVESLILQKSDTCSSR